MTNPDYIYVGDMTPRHQRALRTIVDKYRAGAREHGDLLPGRSWTRDMLGELIDLANYATFQLMELEDAEQPSQLQVQDTYTPV